MGGERLNWALFAPHWRDFTRNSNDFAENVCRFRSSLRNSFAQDRSKGRQAATAFPLPPLVSMQFSFRNGAIIRHHLSSLPFLPSCSALLGIFSHEGPCKVFTPFSRKMALIAPYNSGVMSVRRRRRRSFSLSTSPLSVSALLAVRPYPQICPAQNVRTTPAAHSLACPPILSLVYPSSSLSLAL